MTRLGALIAMTMFAMVAVTVVTGEPAAHAQPALTEPWPQEEEVSDMQQIGGTMTAFLFGFGTGQAIEGRWHEKGWMFTLVDGIAFTGFMGSTIGGLACDYDCIALEGVFIGSMLVLTVSRYWQTYDAAVGPREHNRRLYAKRRKAMQRTVMPLLAPSRSGDGFVGGAALRF